MAGIRERWSSRPAFIMAAVGSAVGLGNLWRFPYVAHQNGGGAFLIPYMVALLTAGIPLMMLEFGLGQKMQSGAPRSFARLKRGFAWVGWWGLAVGTLIVLYYAAVMAWCLIYALHAVTMEWGESPEAVKQFFEVSVLRQSKGPEEIGWPVVELTAALALIWATIFFIIRKGVRAVGKVVMVTVPLPIILLIVLIIRGLTLDGAAAGIEYYLRPDFSKLLEWNVWLAAYGQVFFSLSLGFGILFAYASYRKRRAEVTNNAFITSLVDGGTSFLAGFAVFTVLGYLWTAVAGCETFEAGPELIFITYPLAIAKMPGPHWLGAALGVCFFVTLLLMGIDSAFSIVEAAVTGICDKWKVSREAVTAGFCLCGFLGGLLFVTNGGYYWLCIVDHWISDFSLVMVGFAECVVIGWIAWRQTDKIRNYIDGVSDFRAGWWWKLCIRYVTPVILGAVLVMSFRKEFFPEIDYRLTAGDVKNWPELSRGLAGEVGAQSAGGRLLGLLTPEERELFSRTARAAEAAVARGEKLRLKKEEKERLDRAVSGVLARREFYRAGDLRGAELPERASELLSRGPNALADEEILELNRYILETAFPELVAERRRPNHLAWPVVVGGWGLALLAIIVAVVLTLVPGRPRSPERRLAPVPPPPEDDEAEETKEVPEP